MIGKRVFHKKGGWCVIRRIQGEGRHAQVFVDFEALNVRNFRAVLCDLAEDEKGRPLGSEGEDDRIRIQEVEGTEKPEDAPTPNWLESRRAILALRLGQITETIARDITVGTETIERCFDRLTAAASERKPSFVIVEGPWGTGKTHALTLLKSYARQNRLAMASVVLDGVAVSLGRPIDLLKAIVHVLEFPRSDEHVSFTERIADFVRGGRVQNLRENGVELLASALERIPSSLADEPEAWELVEDYLSGELSANQCSQALRRFHDDTIRLETLYPRGLADRPRAAAQIIKSWAQACRVLPAHGITLLLDEADVELAMGGTTETERTQRKWFLDALSDLAKESIPICVAMAVAPGAGFLDLCSPTEFLHKHLNERPEIVTVPELTPEAMLELAMSIAKTYGTAFGVEDIANEFGNDDWAESQISEMHESPEGLIPRIFIRRQLEYLDLIALGRNE